MHIFITGGSGLLGTAFAKLCKARAISYITPSSEQLDLLDFEKVNQFLATEKPDLIIHCAAYTAVDLAETEQSACWDLNVTALENLLKSSIPIVHFSTDYVFNAPLELQPIPIDYPRVPLNHYGKSKAAAEELLEACTQDWWNIRTTWLYGGAGAEFPMKIKQRATRQSKIEVINDQYGRKTRVQDLSKFILDNLNLDLAESKLKKGHHHFQSPGPVITWYDWAQEILIDWEGEIFPISTESLNLPAKRPQNSVLV